MEMFNLAVMELKENILIVMLAAAAVRQAQTI